MGEFKYTAMDTTGKETEGYVLAPGQAEAIRAVREKGLFPTRVVAVGSSRTPSKIAEPVAKSPSRPSWLTGLIPVSRRKKIATIRKLATMNDAGVPLLRGLRVAASGEKNPRLKAVLLKIGEAIESGSTFSEAVMEHPMLFDKTCVSMVRAGEAGGVLEVTLARLADHLEEEVSLKTSAKCATLCAVAAVSMLAVAAALSCTTFGIPVGTFILTLWSALKVAAAVAILGIGFSFAAPLASDKILLSAPLVGQFIARQSVASFTRLLGLLLNSGVPILQALNITRDAATNRVFSKSIQGIHDAIKEGDSMEAPMEGSGVFPAEVSGLVSVGEETGTLPDMLLRITNMYDGDSKWMISKLNLFSTASVAISIVILSAVVLSRLW